jgi:CRP-like cAMP-binding protein
MILPASSFLFMEGDMDDRMFLVRRGSVRITKREGSRTSILADLGPGAILGEMSLLDREPRSATAITLEETEFVVVDQALLEKTCSELPGWFAAVVRVLVGRLRGTTAKKHGSDLRESIPALLFLLCDPSRGIKTRTLDAISFDMRAIYGLPRMEVRLALEAMASLDLLRMDPDGGIKVPRPDFLSQCYRYLLDLASPNPTRTWDLSNPDASGDALDLHRLGPVLSGASHDFEELVESLREKRR